MRKIDALLEEYGESHQNKLNKTIHWICVPAIFFSILGLFWSIPKGPLASISASPYLNWAVIILVIVIFYYLRLSWSLAVGMILFAAVCSILAHELATSIASPLWLTSVIIFVLAWIGQFYGHKVEGKKPSFLKDLQFLLIGPAWLMHFIYKKIGLPY